MIAFDTNIALYAANSAMPQHEPARQFLRSLAGRDDVIICELMLVEFYLKLRNAKIFPRPLGALDAAARCAQFRTHARWTLVESAPVMNEVWEFAAERSFAFRRIVDVRLALTLRHHGVKEFATSNVGDFEGLGFARVWNPVA